MAKLSAISGRRIRILFLIGVLATLIILYVTTGPRTTRSSPFYKKTQEAIIRARYENDVANAMANAGDANAKEHPQRTQDRSPTGQDRINDAKAQQEAGRGWLEDTLKERLRVAEVAAKKSAEDKWKGVQDAAEKASKEALGEKADIPGELVDDQESKPALGVNAKRMVQEATDLIQETDGQRSQDKPADIVAAQIMEGVQQAAMLEVLSDSLATKDAPPSEPEKSTDDHLSKDPKDSKASLDDGKAALLREITAARDRQKERLKVEYRQRQKAQEMQRQKAAGAIAVDAQWRDKPAARKPGTKVQNPFQVTKEPIRAAEPTTPAELEFQKLLALSPVTIFSKTYCPYSQKAKRILTQAFTITPSPYVVELDQHAHGAEIQQFLADKTGRKTVPNIIVAGKSIGGADDIQEMWEQGQLRDVIKKIAGKRIVGAVENTKP